jgi:CIC family chloride channel protein
MDKDVMVLPHNMAFDEFLRLPEHEGRMRHVIITRDGRISGALRVNTSLRRGLEGSFGGLCLGDIASSHFTIAHGEEIMFTVIGRMWRRQSGVSIVLDAPQIPRAPNVIGVITKEHVADSVADSITPYSASEMYH